MKGLSVVILAVLYHGDEEGRKKTGISRNLCFKLIEQFSSLIPLPSPSYSKTDNSLGGGGERKRERERERPYKTTPPFPQSPHTHIRTQHPATHTTQTPYPNPHNIHPTRMWQKGSIDNHDRTVRRGHRAATHIHALPDFASSPPRSRTERAQPEGSGSRTWIHLAAGNRSNWPAGGLTDRACLFPFLLRLDALVRFQERFFGISQFGGEGRTCFGLVGSKRLLAFSSLFLNVWRLAGGAGGGGLDKKRKEKKTSDKNGVVGLPYVQDCLFARGSELV